MLIVTIQYVRGDTITAASVIARPVTGKPEVIEAADSATRKALNVFERKVLDNQYERVGG